MEKRKQSAINDNKSKKKIFLNIYLVKSELFFATNHQQCHIHKWELSDQGFQNEFCDGRVTQATQADIKMQPIEKKNPSHRHRRVIDENIYASYWPKNLNYRTDYYRTENSSHRPKTEILDNFQKFCICKSNFHNTLSLYMRLYCWLC